MSSGQYSEQYSEQFSEQHSEQHNALMLLKHFILYCSLVKQRSQTLGNIDLGMRV